MSCKSARKHLRITKKIHNLIKDDFCLGFRKCNFVQFNMFFAYEILIFAEPFTISSEVIFVPFILKRNCKDILKLMKK